MSRVREFIQYLLVGLAVIFTAVLGWVAGTLEPEDLPTTWGVDLGGVVESHSLVISLLLLASTVILEVVREFLERREQA